MVNFLIFGLTSGLIGGLILGLFHTLIAGLDRGLAKGLTFGLICGLIGGLFGGLRTRQRSLNSDIQSVETLRWSWVHARKGCINGMIIGSTVGLIAGSIFAIDIFPRRDLFFVLSFVLLGGVIGGLVGLLFGGLQGGIVRTKTIPNLGIKLSCEMLCLRGHWRC